MDSIETTIVQLLDGKPRKDDSQHCDYSLDEQTEELIQKGIEPQLKNYKPVCKKTVCYIVAAVLLNDREEVLMMQEAKSSCAGSWYLPAGRMEPGEDLYQAVKREVLEETGLTFEPSTLIMLENAQGNWYRFVFTGTVTGGELKSVSHADAESLQADWVEDVNQLSLRSKDILPLIEKAKSYWREPSSFHKPVLPQIQAHRQLLVRLITVIRKKENNRVHVLVSLNGDSHHLPCCEINPTRSVHAALKRYMQVIFGCQPPPHKPHGLVSVEYNGCYPGEKDGLCLTLVISCKVPLEQALPTSRYSWLEVSKNAEVQLLKRLNKNMTVALSVIR